MKKVASIIITAVIASSPIHSFAWGAAGHKMVAEIANVYLDSATKEKIHHYLGNTTIEEAATWMDDIKSNHNYDYMKPWHYVDFEKGTQYVPTKEGNSINTMNNAIEEIKHRDQHTDEEIKKDIMMIYHLTGDMHQPLHNGYTGDKGGNDIQVKYLGHPSNLHTVWDREIIESEHITPNDCLLLYKNFDKDEIAQLRVVNMEKWILEPRTLLSNVYNFKDDNVLDQAYVDKNKRIVEQQLLIAGIRLAAVLQEVFKS